MGDGFDKKAIFLPFLRIFVNVLPNFAVILLTTDNMIVIGTLEYVVTDVTIHKPF